MMVKSLHTGPRVHTQNIENILMCANCKLKRQFGTTRSLFPSELHKFLLRNRFRNDDFLNNFLACIADNYI